MPQSLDSLLTLLAGAGWSDKKLQDLLEQIRREDPTVLLKSFRGYRRGLADAQKKGRSKPTESLDKAVGQALKLLQSAGPYTESEILEALNAEAVHFGMTIPTVAKGGLRTWLAAFGAAVGADKMKRVATAVRNDFVHHPRPGWTVRDVK